MAALFLPIAQANPGPRNRPTGRHNIHWHSRASPLPPLAGLMHALPVDHPGGRRAGPGPFFPLPPTTFLSPPTSPHRPSPPPVFYCYITVHCPFLSPTFAPRTISIWHFHPNWANLLLYYPVRQCAPPLEPFHLPSSP